MDSVLGSRPVLDTVRGAETLGPPIALVLIAEPRSSRVLNPDGAGP
jgi:hypothetical protein